MTFGTWCGDKEKLEKKQFRFVISAFTSDISWLFENWDFASTWRNVSSSLGKAKLRNFFPALVFYEGVELDKREHLLSRVAEYSANVNRNFSRGRNFASVFDWFAQLFLPLLFDFKRRHEREALKASAQVQQKKEAFESSPWGNERRDTIEATSSTLVPVDVTSSLP